jgi:nicotinate dehydrogenase subunit B
MGQGPITSLPMELAEELDVALENVDLIMADTDLCPWNEGTYGSLSTRVFGQVLRAAAAEARAVLIELAAEKLSVNTDQLMVSEGIVFDRNNKNKNITYAAITKGKKIFKALDKKPSLKDPSEFKIMGKSRYRVDSVEKVTGEAKYSGDIQLPGMLYARIVRPPALKATLKNVDTSEAGKIDGIRVVRVDNLVAVLHEHLQTADLAVTLVKAEWEVTEMNVNHETIFKYLLETGTRSREVDKGGNIQEGPDSSAVLFENEYHDGYVAHAPIENHTATVMMDGDKMIIWASSQTPYPARAQVAEALNMPEANVQLKPIFLGGGFGGKIYNQQIIEAALIARAAGKPVQLTWTRREEFLYDRLRPAAVVRINSGLASAGKISYWDYNVYFAGSRGAAHFYDIPHHQTLEWGAESGKDPHPFFTGAWRAPANNTNTFARESQIDIMAAKAGIDPVEFRMQNMKDERMIRVLKTLTNKFGWTAAPGPSGRGNGIALGQDAGTDVGVAVEVSVNESAGEVLVKRAVVAQDMGLVVNPQGARIQVEGCVNMGVGYALKEEIEFEGSNMLTWNFDSYDIARFSFLPETIEVYFVDHKNPVPQAGGEPAIICMGGAIANAIFDACGARLFRMPMTPDRVLEALKEV